MRTSPFPPSLYESLAPTLVSQRIAEQNAARFLGLPVLPETDAQKRDRIAAEAVPDQPARLA